MRDFLASRHYCQQAISDYDDLKKLGIDTDVGTARKLMQLMSVWSKEPLICAPQKLYVLISDVEARNSEAVRQFGVRSSCFAPLSLTTNDPRLKVQLADTKRDPIQAADHEYYFEQKVIVRVPIQDTDAFDATVVVRSPTFPGFQARIPVHIETQNLIRLSTPTVFFGFVKANQALLGGVKLSATVPFHIVKLESDNPSVKAICRAEMENSNDRYVELQLSPMTGGQVCEGRIRVMTDLFTQKMIEIPYLATAQ